MQPVDSCYTFNLAQELGIKIIMRSFAEGDVRSENLSRPCERS